ncbi:MAG: hypothetical protein GC136_01415 [Alphaproteobacteria bacterium]|nr:hypothetical protein [Alphaproteobacteria bacterium]
MARVLIERGEFIDSERDNRKVPFKFYYPEGEKNLPLVVWSHGLGGGADGAGFIARHLAENNYAVLHLQHLGTDTSLWEGKPGHPWENIRKAFIPRKAVLNRYKDVPFVMQFIEAEAQKNNPIWSIIDFSRLGMSGHSFGSLTTQIMAGQYIVKGSRKYQLPWPAFKAGILYSPVPAHRHGADPAIMYSGFQIPMFFMTGTDDESPLEGFTYDLRLAPYEHSGAPESYLLVLKDGDHMVYNGSRGQLKENSKRERHEDIILQASLAYWNYYLKGEKEGLDWLVKGGFANYLGADGTFEHKRLDS